MTDYLKHALEVLLTVFKWSIGVLLLQHLASMTSVVLDGIGYLGFPAVFLTYQAYPDNQYFDRYNLYLDVFFVAAVYCYLLFKKFRQLRVST
ncbi:hypothetical protein ACFSJ3_05720 [Corallincola platygyrae]|uniref:Uncharacterized protein n=1 Tax=Corallincola platygyrae TaxID=1193278 RepID=A0ABW4XKH8_9GAMM